MLTVKEVAALLRVSKMSVHRFIAKGSLPAVRVGGQFRIEPADVDRYLEVNRTVRRVS